jgi:hypothetical protein
MSARAGKLREAAARRRFSALLAALLALVLVQPLLRGVTGSPAALSAAAALLFALGIAATERSGPLRALGWALALAWLGASLAAAAVPALTASLALAFLLTRATFRALLAHPRADAEALAGAVFGYFLLALLWAELYAAIALASPGAFAAPEGRPDAAAFLYFSLVTLTTLGYGDIQPAAPFARIAAGLQAAVGTLYVAVLIGRIVGAFGPAEPHRSAGGAEEAGRER